MRTDIDYAKILERTKGVLIKKTTKYIKYSGGGGYCLTYLVFDAFTITDDAVATII